MNTNRPRIHSFSHYSDHKEKRKMTIKKIAATAMGNKAYNPKNARYRSLKGINLDRYNLISFLTIQILPIILLTLLLLVKLIFQ